MRQASFGTLIPRLTCASSVSAAPSRSDAASPVTFSAGFMTEHTPFNTSRMDCKFKLADSLRQDEHVTVDLALATRSFEFHTADCQQIRVCHDMLYSRQQGRQALPRRPLKRLCCGEAAACSASVLMPSALPAGTKSAPCICSARTQRDYHTCL
jgi:hypothetical protein